METSSAHEANMDLYLRELEIVIDIVSSYYSQGNFFTSNEMDTPCLHRD